MNETELQRILRVYQDNLPEGNLESFRIDPIDHLGVPIVDVTFLPKPYQRLYNGVGYGETELNARLSAFGEMYEIMNISEAFLAAPVQVGSYQEMVRRQGAQVIDPLTMVLPAGSPYTPDTPLRWTEVKRLSDDAPAWVPSEFVTNIQADVAYPQQLTTAITNGDGAGESRERALLHGLLELLQRDGNCDSFRALDQGKIIEVDGIAPATRQLMADLEAKGLTVIPKLARPTCGCVSVYAVGNDRSDDPFPLSVTACGEAADPDFDRAMRKAVLECASSHARKLFYHCSFDRKSNFAPPGYIEKYTNKLVLEEEEPRALRAMVEWLSLSREQLYRRLADTVFSQKEVVSPENFPRFASNDIGERLQTVRQGIATEGMEAYYFSATPADHPVQVTKAIVPGMEMELGSYHRLGARGVQRLLDQNDGLISRTAGAGKARVRLTDAQEEAVGGQCWLDVARLDDRVAPLYPLYREPSEHAAPFALENGYFDQKRE
jgi:ribosomal protein S12 methylthiotransferase accessory factor